MFELGNRKLITSLTARCSAQQNSFWNAEFVPKPHEHQRAWVCRWAIGYLVPNIIDLSGSSINANVVPLMQLNYVIDTVPCTLTAKPRLTATSVLLRIRDAILIEPYVARNDSSYSVNARALLPKQLRKQPTTLRKTPFDRQIYQIIGALQSTTPVERNAILSTSFPATLAHCYGSSRLTCLNVLYF